MKKVDGAKAPRKRKGPEAGAPSPVPGLSMSDLGVGDGTVQPNLPRLAPRAAALFTFHPERWMVMEGEVIPALGAMPLVGGVGGVRVNRQTKKLVIADAITNKAKRGWAVLPLDIDGPGTSYLHTPCPGVFLTRFETANAGSAVITPDRKGYVAWLRGLIASGKIPGPRPYVLEQLRTRLRADILHYQDKVRTVPSVQVELDALLLSLEAVDRELGVDTLVPVEAAPVDLGDITEPQDGDADTDDADDVE